MRVAVALACVALMAVAVVVAGDDAQPPPADHQQQQQQEQPAAVPAEQQPPQEQQQPEEVAQTEPPAPLQQGCVSWRQTGGCSPTGPREASADLPCSATVPSGSSGYCECAGGRKVREVPCDHEPFSCAHECLQGNCVSWRQTANCDPSGPRLPDMDLPCTTVVPQTASGYCECDGGRKVALSGCQHESFTCAHACSGGDHEELEWDSHPIHLTDGTFNQVVAQHEIVMVNFYVDWCRYCTMLKPVYVQAAKLLKKEGHSRARFATVDCLADDTVMTRGTYEVTKYPTLKLFRNGKLLKREFRGQRTARNLVDYVVELLKDPVTLMPPVTEKGLLMSHSKAVFAQFNEKGPHYAALKSAFQSVAEALQDDCGFGLSTQGATDSITFKTVGVENHYKGSLDGSDPDAVKEEMLKWASDECNPLVRELTFANGEEITEEGIPILVLFYDPAKPEPVREFTQVVLSRFQKERSHVNFVTADGTKFSHPLRHLGKTKADLPVIAVDTFKHMFLFKSFDKIRRAGPLEKWLKKLHNGELHRNFHAQVPLPEEDDDYYDDENDHHDGEDAAPQEEKKETLKEKLAQAQQQKQQADIHAEVIKQVEEAAAVEQKKKQQQQQQQKPKPGRNAPDHHDDDHHDDDEELAAPVPISSVLNKLKPSANRYSFERNREEL